MIRIKRYDSLPIIDLDGPAGNAFCLMGTAQAAVTQLGYTPIEVGLMLDDMRSGDYEHLLEVFEKHLGMYFILEREDRDEERM